MGTREALLKAVLANPADDLPRLVYADWLEENGQPERADVIRCHIEAAKRFPATGVTGRTHYVTTDGVEASEFFRLMSVVTTYTSDPSKNGLGGPLAELAGRNNVVWSRGFVTVVCCTLADWCGGACERCAGTRLSFPDRGRLVPCPACSGTGRTVGIGPTVVRSHPVERVVLTDREPERSTWSHGGQEGEMWTWYKADGPLTTDERYVLPACLDELRGGYSHTTRDAALDALSAALIDWAKSQPA